MSSGQVLNMIQCPDSRRMVKGALESGWEWVGYAKSGHVEIRWPATGQVIPCSTTPSDRNAWKNFARRVKAVSGVDLLGSTKHRRSRKNPNAPDPQVEAARRKHRRQLAAREAAERAERERIEQARRRQAAAAARAADEDRRRREIESLMQPGWGR